jgi:hypothetical protein
MQLIDSNTEECAFCLHLQLCTATLHAKPCEWPFTLYSLCYAVLCHAMLLSVTGYRCAVLCMRLGTWMCDACALGAIMHLHVMRVANRRGPSTPLPIMHSKKGSRTISMTTFKKIA